MLLHHRDKLTPLLYNDAQTCQLPRLLEHRRGPVDLRTLLSNMLPDALKSYYPQALPLAGQALLVPVACQVPPQVARARPSEALRKFYYAQRCRRPELIEQRLAALAQIKPLSTDPALIGPAKLQVEMLAASYPPCPGHQSV